jgi:hypothetical protein
LPRRISTFRGKTFVIAFGGEVVADETFLGIVHDLNLLHSLGVHIVVVHGSRPQIEAIPRNRASRAAMRSACASPTPRRWTRPRSVRPGAQPYRGAAV